MLGIDDRSQELLALVTFVGSVGAHNVLVDGPGDFDLGEVRVDEQARYPLLLPGGEQIRAGVQGPSRPIERV